MGSRLTARRMIDEIMRSKGRADKTQLQTSPTWVCRMRDAVTPTPWMML